MPTATELDNFRTAPVVHPSSRPESDAKSPGGGKWQQRNNRQRFSKFGITIYGTKRNGRGSTEEWQPTGGGGRDSAVTCVTRTQDGVNLCTDILLQPELYLDLFTHRGNDDNGFKCVHTYDLWHVYVAGKTTSSNPLLEFCLDGGKILKEELSDEIKATSPPANTHHILTICSNLKHLSGSDEQSVCHSCLDITAKMGLSSTELSNQELPTQLVSGVGRSQCCLALLNLLSQKEGCDINVQDSQGFSALHFLINGKCVDQ